MKNVKTLFSKGFKAVLLVAVFGLVLGFSSIPASVSAQMVSGSIVATPDTIDRGGSTEIRWNSFDANSVSITPGIGNVAPSGSERVSPTQTTTYTIHIRNTISGSATQGTATVFVRDVQGGTCQDRNATNFGGALPCRYTETCQDRDAINFGGSLPCRFDNDDNREKPDVTTKSATGVERDEATLRGEVDGNGLSTRVWFEYSRDKDDVEDGDGEETDEQSTGSGSRSFDEDIDGLRENTRYYFRAVARNSEGTDYGSILSFTTDDDNDNGGTCNNSSALNYRGSLPCRYPTTTAQPTVVIYADSTNIAYGSATTVRWSTMNATSCFASNGSTGWAGVKSIGPSSFYTGSLTGSRTYTLTCSNASGSDTDSVTVNVRGRTTTTTVTPPPASSLVVITSSIDRNQPIVPTLDNTRPHVGDEINYTVTYQNIGTAAIRNLTLRLDLPREVDYMFSTPSNPSRSGNTLIFSLGTLGANGQGTVSVRVRVREDAGAGAFLNFPAILSYTDPSGFPQSVSANVSAQVWSNPETTTVIDERTVVPLGASVFGAGFWPTSLFGWLLFLVLILVLIMLVRTLFAAPGTPAPWNRKTITTTVQH